MADNAKPTGTAAGPDTKKRISLKEKISMLSLLMFNFVDLQVTQAKDGSKVVILQLETPIPHVRGSQEVEYKGKRVAIPATDVTEIKIHEDDINDDFEFDRETNYGSYKGDKLVLDVSKQGQVWLRSTTFAASGNEYRSTLANDRLAKLIGGTTPAGKALEPTV